MTLTAAQAARPEIPLALFADMTDLERALYYIALRDRNEQVLASREALRSGGVCYSAMSGGGYTPKTYDEMLAEAEAKVAAQAERMAVA